jgi:tRNA (cytidine/uridine-2'-O-)-methyltransferase
MGGLVQTPALGRNAPMPRVFLHAPGDFNNVCVLARTLDVLGFSECYVFDPRRIIRDAYGKSYSRRLRIVSAGAFEHILWHRIADPLAFVLQRSGRTVATVADPGATSLRDFQFEADDLLMFGSESEGLPAAIVAAASVAVTIPTYGSTESLNLAVAASIFLFEATRQLGGAILR